MMTVDTRQSNPSSLSDEELVLRARHELPYESRSFRVLMNRYQRKVMSKAESMLNNIDDAKDMTQEVFLKVYNNLPKFKLKSSFSTWLYIVTVNTCLNLIDKRRRNPQWWLTEDLDSVHATTEETEIFMILGKAVEQRDVRECIERTLVDFDPEQREVLELRFLEELDYQTIADKLKIGLSAMKMRLKRARESFRRLFEDKCLESE